MPFKEWLSNIFSTKSESELGNVFDDVKERISSPFISAFLIAWLLINWSVILLFFSMADGDFIKLISNWHGPNRFLWNPFWLAFLYCFFQPLISWGIVSYRTWIKVLSNKTVNKIAVNSPISFEQYMTLKKDFNDVKKAAEDHILEGTTKTDIIGQLERKKLEQSQIIREWELYNSINILQGDWLITGVSEASYLKIQGTKVSKKLVDDSSLVPWLDIEWVHATPKLEIIIAFRPVTGGTINVWRLGITGDQYQNWEGRDLSNKLIKMVRRA